MKKLYALFIACLSVLSINAQENSLNLDFSDPAHADRFNFIFDSGGEVVKTVTNGEIISSNGAYFFMSAPGVSSIAPEASALRSMAGSFRQRRGDRYDHLFYPL